MRRSILLGAGFGIASLAVLLAVPGTPVPMAAPEEPVSVAVVRPATTGVPVVAASFNVCKVSCDLPAPSWDVRRERVARVIAESGADVIGIQEATNNPTSTARTQAEDVAALVAAAGYRPPAYPGEANECRRPRDAQGQLAGPSPCDNTAMLVFRPSTIEQVTLPGGQPSAGIVMASTIAPGIDSLSGMRSVAWAYLQVPGSTPFLAISVHTDSAKTPEAEVSRIALGRALGDWTDAWNADHGLPGIPVVLMADLNSYAKRQPNGAQQALVDTGWLDTFRAPTKRNTQYSTINYNPLLGISEQGFPVRPYQFRATRKNPNGEATRIDYVMARGAAVAVTDYEVVIRLAPDGSFIPDYQASDHQMVRATVVLPPG